MIYIIYYIILYYIYYIAYMWKDATTPKAQRSNTIVSPTRCGWILEDNTLWVDIRRQHVVGGY